jgi:predicted metalloendopeptidase
VDRGEWGLTASTVNAYYEPTRNEIVFPAGILQPPFFDPEADDAVNYGAIGMVIGHEMTHGFDDQGRQYDEKGNLRDWWQASDAKAYDQRAAMVVKEFDSFEAQPGLHVNGKLTLGENIADLGGLKIAYAAWRASLHGQEPAPIDGFTGPQRFFLGFAQSWRSLQRPESEKLQVNTDPHSPSKFRVIGPLANLPEFYEAFGCKDGDAMKRGASERPAIW